MPYLEDFEVQSRALCQTRRVTVFRATNDQPSSQFPVLFCADGQLLHAFANTLRAATENGSTPPVTLIGIHSSDQSRAHEYLTGYNPERFFVHERFFCDEVRSWARDRFKLDLCRELSGVFGFSNGGAFAISMGTLHPEKYGLVIAFSIPGDPNRAIESDSDPTTAPRYYLSAGTRECGFRRTTAKVAKILSARGITLVHTERQAGHELRFWMSELVQAIAWAFPPHLRSR